MTQPDHAWPEPWHPVPPSMSLSLEGQLWAEMPSGHILSGEDVTVLARRNDTDDILLRLQDGRVAEVHLTWSKTQAGPEWPWTVFFSSLPDWVENVRSGGPANR